MSGSATPYRPLVVYAGLSNLIFYIPVLILYFRHVGLSAAESFALVSIYSLVLAVAELPTGVLADALGARRTLVTSSLVGAAGALTLAVGSSFAVLGLGETLVALGLSLRSGAQSAYAYGLAGGTRYRAAESTITALSYVGLAVSAMLAGTLFSLGPSVVFVATAAALLCAATVLQVSGAGGARAVRPTPASVVARLGRRLRADHALLVLLVVFAAFTTMTGLAYWSFQLYLDAVGVPVGLIGPAYALSFLAAALGARVAARVNQRFGAGVIVLAQGLILTGCLVAMSEVRNPLGVAVLPLVQLTTGYVFPTFYGLLQARVDDGERATLVSLAALLQRGALAFALLAFGWFTTIGSLTEALSVTAASGLLFVLAAPLTIRRLERTPVPATT